MTPEDIRHATALELAERIAAMLNQLEPVTEILPLGERLVRLLTEIAEGGP